MRSAALVGLLLVAIGCAPPDGTGTLAGALSDEITGLPVSAAVIEADGLRTTTDGEGRFFLALAPGPHALVIEAAGYLRSTVEGVEGVEGVGGLVGEGEALRVQIAPARPTHALEHVLADRRAAARVALQPLPGDLRPSIDPETLPSLPLAAATQVMVRVWRRGVDGSTASCSGRVDTVPLEEYVKHVLPHEWIPSWEDESLKAGAVAARSFARYWVQAGGKYSCADVDDTIASQVYKDTTVTRASAAVDATLGQVVLDTMGRAVLAEYSAENGSPTATGVADPLCTGKTVFGHGRGMCQWGTQRRALAGEKYDTMATTYYPGRVLSGGNTNPSPPPAVSPWAAGIGKMQGPPAEMRAGESALVWFEFVNEGDAVWDPAQTLLGTTEPRERASAFYTPSNWLSSARPTGVDARVAPGAIGRFTFVITAPEVVGDTELVEHFGLVQQPLVEGDATWFGPADDATGFTILVHPSDGAASGSPAREPDAPAAEGEDPGGRRAAAAEEDLGAGVYGGCSASGAPGGGSQLALWGIALLLSARTRRRSSPSDPAARP